MGFSLEQYQEAAAYLKERTNGFTPDLAMILGTGLGPFAEMIEDAITVDYKDIPHFLITTNPAHAGKMIFGRLSGKNIVCMSGRFHSYEGYDMEDLALPVRVLYLLGARTIVLTNAAGAVNMEYRPGDVMLIQDHIKLTGDSPMRGKNIDFFGPRFFDISKMYTPELLNRAEACATGSGLTLHRGTYMFFTGPQFETPAEIRAARVLGADAVGMSTVTEALTAAHCGMKVLGISIITNMAAGILDAPLSDEEVQVVANMISERFSAFVRKVVEVL